jgi:hypothetical protein
MEKSKKNLELIDKFIDNERKSRIWTTINIGIFCLLGLAVFWLAYELNKSNAKFKTQNIELRKIKDQLDSALRRLSAYNASLQEDSLSLSNRVGNYDSLKKVLDTVLIIYNQSQAHTNNNVSGDNKIKEYTQNVREDRELYKVYLHFMPGYEKMSAKATQQLKRNKYTVPGQEKVTTVTFDPVVKYFHEEDEGEARKIARLISNSDPYFDKNPVTLQKLNLKSPMRQLEVWIGEYRQKDVDQILQQPIRNFEKKASY